MSASTPCDSQAEIFLQTGPWQQNERSFSIIIDCDGSGSGKALSFVSATSLSAITAAINTLTGVTGIQSEQSDSNPQRIRMYSVSAGLAAFVSVQQIGGNAPNVFALSTGGSPMWQFIAHGENGLPGDSNCDAIVNVADLFDVIGHWGSCPHPTIACLGDVNVDHVVNVTDLLTVISSWGAMH